MTFIWKPSFNWTKKAVKSFHCVTVDCFTPDYPLTLRDELKT